jgi:ABC-type multidrug transport system permease subunit
MNSPVSFGKLVAASTISTILVLFIGYFVFIYIAMYFESGRNVPPGVYTPPIEGVKVN